jgi:D-arabinose 1-dehydrogenase-like Zn-dependent alcohol dehydrogenase
LATLKGRAALYQGFERGFRIEELPTPEVEPGGVLVRVTSAAICGSDLHYWRGDSRMPEKRCPALRATNSAATSTRSTGMSPPTRCAAP